MGQGGQEDRRGGQGPGRGGEGAGRVTGQQSGVPQGGPVVGELLVGVFNMYCAIQ